MKKLMSCFAAVALLGMGGLRTASAVTACHDDTENSACKDLRTCASTILKEAKGYVANMQNDMITSIGKNLEGKNQYADGNMKCKGGTHKLDGSTSANGTTCGYYAGAFAISANNGYCTSGAYTHRPCDRDTDCPGACTGNGLACTSNGDCMTPPCVDNNKLCNHTKGCNAFDQGAAGYEDDNNKAKCEVDNIKGGTAANFAKRSKTLRANIFNKCGDGLPGSPIDLSDLGLPTKECKGKCRAGGGGSLEACGSTFDCGNCKNTGTVTGHHCLVATDCTNPPVSDPPGTTCDTSGGTCTSSYEDVADCVTQGSGGDLLHGIAVDAVTRPISRIAYITRPNGVYTGSATVPQMPRKRAVISLASLIQIAVKSTGDGAGSAGGSTPSGLARCANAGAMTGQACVEDKDCDNKIIKSVGEGGTAKCVPDCCTCTSGPPAPACGAAGPHPAGDIASSVKNLCSAAGDIVCESRGIYVAPGNLLSAPTNNVANGIRTCLVTHLARVPDSTLTTLGDSVASDRGHCIDKTTSAVGPVCTDSVTCLLTQVCTGGLTNFGGINITTGDSSSSAPIATDVFLTTSTPSGKACPLCVGGACDSGIGTPGVACSAADNETDGACLPDDPGTGGAWSQLATIPNPFNLGTGKTQATASGSAPVQTGWPAGNGFCGFCSGNFTVGCRTDYAPDPDPCIALGLGTCSLTGTYAGFRGDPTYDDDLSKPGMNATVEGIPDLYTSTAGGIFCAGQAGSALVDKGVGLPGPVRVLQPYLTVWYFATKN